MDVRLGHNKDGNLSGGEKQTSGESKVTFKSGEALLYSAAAEDGIALKNYWVTFLTQQPGAKLFVNGINDETRDKDEETGDPVREVFLTGDYDYHHDIFFANIGSQALTGLKVELLDAQNVRLDDYWTIQQDGVTSLAPFTETSYGDELANVSKIRLQPIVSDGIVQSGPVSGTLKISSANGGSVSIKLKGTAGAPQIVTDILPQGVKYVHYSSLIQTNSMYGSNSVRFSLAPGSNLSSIGLSLKPNGEIYGVPTREVTGYKFTVAAEFSGEVSAAASWARESGLLPEGQFIAAPAMSRGQMAVMLVKYLKYLGFDCALPSKPVAFTDATQMTEEENAAFQVLYQYGIFKGTGNYTMDVSGPTTRAQFAVLIHQLSVFVGE